MIDWLTGTVFGKFISTFAISMVPVVELRLGLPYGIAQGLAYPLALTAAVLGNMFPTPFIIVKGEDGGRELCERVERFIAPLTKEVLVFDTKEIELPVDDEFRPLLSSLVADSVVYTLMKPFEVERNHDLKVRRYYRQMEY